MQKERAQTFKESPNTATTRTLSDTAKHACQASESDRAFVAACGAGQALTRAERAGRAAYVPPWARQVMAGRIDDAAVPHSCCPGEGRACWRHRLKGTPLIDSQGTDMASLWAVALLALSRRAVLAHTGAGWPHNGHTMPWERCAALVSSLSDTCINFAGDTDETNVPVCVCAYRWAMSACGRPSGWVRHVLARWNRIPSFFGTHGNEICQKMGLSK